MNNPSKDTEKVLFVGRGVIFCFIGNSSFIKAKNKHMFIEHMLDKKKMGAIL